MEVHRRSANPDTYNGGDMVFISIASKETYFPITYTPTDKKVSITYNTNDNIFPNLPPNITHLSLQKFRHSQQHIQIPTTVIGLFFIKKYNYPITIPSHVTSFQMPINYTHPIVLPPRINLFCPDFNATQPIIITNLYPKTIYLIRYKSTLPTNIFKYPMMYYLLECIQSYNIRFVYAEHLKNIELRANINKYNFNKRCQGLFDDL